MKSKHKTHIDGENLSWVALAFVLGFLFALLIVVVLKALTQC